MFVEISVRIEVSQAAKKSFAVPSGAPSSPAALLWRVRHKYERQILFAAHAVTCIQDLRDRCYRRAIYTGGRHGRTVSSNRSWHTFFFQVASTVRCVDWFWLKLKSASVITSTPVIFLLGYIAHRVGPSSQCAELK